MAKVSHSCVVSLVFGIAVVTAAAGAPAASAKTIVFAGGTSGALGDLIPKEIFGDPDALLGGAYKEEPFVALDYPGSLWPITGPFDQTLGSSIAVGTSTLISLVKATNGPLLVAGTSQGGIVVQLAEAALNSDSEVPSNTTFVIFANPNFGILQSLYGALLPIVDYRPQPLSETRFITQVVVNQYDGFADSIGHPWNLLADLNAFMSLIYVHPFAQNSDLTTVPAANITVRINSQGGVTTTYLVPTEQLPLTMPLRQLCVPAPLVDAIDNVLRPIIDAAYDRNMPYPPLATPASIVAAQADPATPRPGRGVVSGTRKGSSQAARAQSATGSRTPPR